MSSFGDTSSQDTGSPNQGDDEAQPTRNGVQQRGRGRLVQQSLFRFAVAATRAANGKSKRQQDYECNIQDSLPWGDPHVPGNSVRELGLFRILSHNVNGLSKANYNTDVMDFARSLKDKAVSLFGIQETNRNFEVPHMLDSFHNAIKGVSSHHHGAVSSAKLKWQTDHQPGGTAVSVRDKWATRFLSKGSDDMGRWSWVTLSGQGTTKITFISGYRVCEGAPESSITSRTVRSQQEWIYADRGMP